jgi:DNA primase
MSYDADDVRARLDDHDHRRIFQKCGFEINGQSGPELSGILGPKALGEGESGNFSVDLRNGLVKDWGDSDYEGDVFDVVQDVQGLDFNEALEWIVDELNLDVESDGRPNGQFTGTSSPESNRPPNEESEPEPVVSHDQVERWHERLMSDTEAAQAARSYLTDERGLTTDVLKAARIGLAHSPEDYRATWWIMIPVPHRSGGNPPPIVAVKGFAFNPAATDWKRTDDGDKIPRNAGSAALYDLVPSDPFNSPVVVCEGELDALSALSHGFNAVTGTSGAGTFRDEWAAYLSRLAPAQDHGIVVAFDGDEKGRKWGPEHAATLHEAGLDVRIASLPDGRDVNDVLVSGGRDALESHLAQAEPFSPTEEAPASEETVDRTEAKETEQDSDPSYEPFPLRVLPGPVRAYVRAASEALPAPPAMVAVPTLSVLSGAIGDAARLELKRSWTEPATLWTVLVAPSGSTKSPAFKHAVRPIFRRESEARDEYEQALAQWKQQEEPDEQDKPTRDRYRTGDATPEAIVKILNENPRGILLARDELGAWIGSFDRYVNGAADLQFWVEVWQGIQASRDRAGEGNTTVDTPAVPVTGTIQPGTLTEKLDEIHFDTGFAARLIFCKPPPKPKRWTEADVSRDVRDRYDRLLGRLYGKDWGQPVTLEPYTLVSLSPDAKAAWIEYYNEANRSLEARPEGPAKAVAAKGITHTARLALILHLCRKASGETDSTEVDAASMEAALEIGQWLTGETLRVYNELNLDDAALSPKRRFLQRLPDRFKTAEAKEIAEEDEIPERTCEKWLRDLVDGPNLEKIKRGLYQKP